MALLSLVLGVRATPGTAQLGAVATTLTAHYGAALTAASTAEPMRSDDLAPMGRSARSGSDIPPTELGLRQPCVRVEVRTDQEVAQRFTDPGGGDSSRWQLAQDSSAGSGRARSPVR
ncbi:hypothetical protein ACIRPK_22645 [Kitasatospora sp. NPDC101801]|uniref:hypothetical protein n=1 Tax=Kitasatospora sp. NPDC101801 TaxID=3364103 RepID=UPI0038013139